MISPQLLSPFEPSYSGGRLYGASELSDKGALTQESICVTKMSYLLVAACHASHGVESGKVCFPRGVGAVPAGDISAPCSRLLTTDPDEFIK